MTDDDELCNVSNGEVSCVYIHTHRSIDLFAEVERYIFIEDLLSITLNKEIIFSTRNLWMKVSELSILAGEIGIDNISHQMATFMIIYSFWVFYDYK